MTPWRHVVPKPLRVQASAWLARRRSARLRRRLAAMSAGPATIVAGPWLGEVGFELLYWAPFLRWVVERFQIDPGRLVVVSRGGTASWYGGIASRYRDVFDDVAPEAFRQQHDDRVRVLGEQKQRQISEFDRTLLRLAAQREGLSEWTMLHPALMYELFNPYWWGHLSIEWVHAHARYACLPPISSDVAGPPGSYVAVKFYFNDCFPPTDTNRGFARNVMRALADRGPVMALSTGLEIDDHDGLRDAEQGVRYLPPGLEPSRNLELQSAVVSNARAFIGTYGGFSYLAPLYGVPSLAFFSDAGGFSRKHLAMAQSAFERIGSRGRLDVCDLSPSEQIAERAWAAAS